MGSLAEGAKRPSRQGAAAPHNELPTRVLPAHIRVYAVGDIHGCSRLLDDLHARIASDAANCRKQTYVVYLGDYIDRGPDSKGVIDRLSSNVPADLTPVFLKGNHDAILLDFLNDAEIYRVWGSFGAAETLVSYGIRPPLFESSREFEAARRALCAALPPAHLAFLKSLLLWWSAGDYVFVHAGLKPNLALEEQQESDLLWIRGEFFAAGDSFGRTVVHGHTPGIQPVRNSYRIGVDTGAYATGLLTAAVLEAGTCRFISV